MDVNTHFTPRDLTLPKGLNMPQTLQGTFSGQPVTTIWFAVVKATASAEAALSTEVTLLLRAVFKHH